jgi:hypothetical protein
MNENVLDRHGDCSLSPDYSHEHALWRWRFPGG